MGQDERVNATLEVLTGTPSFDLEAELLKVIRANAVPNRPEHYLKASGLRKLYAALDERRRITDDSPPPVPEFAREDFSDATAWRLRGKLNIPRERFIHYAEFDSVAREWQRTRVGRPLVRLGRLGRREARRRPGSPARPRPARRLGGPLAAVRPPRGVARSAAGVEGALPCRPRRVRVHRRHLRHRPGHDLLLPGVPRCVRPRGGRRAGGGGGGVGGEGGGAGEIKRPAGRGRKKRNPPYSWGWNLMQKGESMITDEEEQVVAELELLGIRYLSRQTAEAATQVRPPERLLADMVRQPSARVHAPPSSRCCWRIPNSRRRCRPRCGESARRNR